MLGLGCSSLDNLAWRQGNQRKHSSFHSLAKQAIPEFWTCHTLQLLWKVKEEHDSKPTEKLRHVYAFRLLSLTVLRPWRNLDNLLFLLVCSDSSSGQSLHVPAGTGNVCPAARLSPKCVKFEWWAVDFPGRGMRLSFSAILLVLPVAALSWQLYLLMLKEEWFRVFAVFMQLTVTHPCSLKNVHATTDIHC